MRAASSHDGRVMPRRRRLMFERSIPTSDATFWSLRSLTRIHSESVMSANVRQAHSACQVHCVGDVVDSFIRSAQHAQMNDEPDDNGSFTNSYLRAWRKYRGLTLEGVAPEFQMTHQNLGRIERGELPYNPFVMETAARLYQCELADLLGSNPYDQAVKTVDMMRQLSPEQLAMLQAQIRGLLGAA